MQGGGRVGKPQLCERHVAQTPPPPRADLLRYESAYFKLSASPTQTTRRGPQASTQMATGAQTSVAGALPIRPALLFGNSCDLKLSAPADQLMDLLDTLPMEIQKRIMVRALKGSTIDQRRAAGLLPGRMNVHRSMFPLINNRQTLSSTTFCQDTLPRVEVFVADPTNSVDSSLACIQWSASSLISSCMPNFSVHHLMMC